GNKGRTDQQHVLGRRRIPVRTVAVDQGTEHRRPRYHGIWLRWRKPVAGRPRWDGDVAVRSLNRDVLRRPWRPGDGFDRPRWIGGAETDVAAAAGAPGQDRLLRPDRATGGLGDRRRAHDDGEARGRYVGPQRPEAVDWQRAVVRYLDHLGARRRRQPGQGLHRREQDHTRVQRREDTEQDRAQGRPERSDHAERL